MIGFSYIYKSSDEILQGIPSLSSMNLWDVLLLTTAIILVIACVFIIFPSVMIMSEYKQQKRDKKNKKKILTQILLQKEIEDEVEKEIKIEWEDIIK
jgi:large-conductance mechanosensitive channel